MKRFLDLFSPLRKVRKARNSGRSISEYDLERQRLLDQVVDITQLPPARGNLRILQLAVLNMARLVDKICRENGIEYWICSGSLIGAVVHGGFVPWDDDFDIMMTRENYDKFIKVCLEHKDDFIKMGFGFSARWIFQIIYNPGGAYVAHVDIFPMDLYYKDMDLDHWHRPRLPADTKVPVLNINNNNDATHEPFWKQGTSDIAEYNRQYDVLKQKFNQEVMQGNAPDYKNGVVMSGFERLRGRGSLCKAKHLYPLKDMEFEGHKFMVPNDPESVLYYQYGDIWHIPKDFGRPKHGGKFKMSFRKRELLQELSNLPIDNIYKKLFGKK